MRIFRTTIFTVAMLTLATNSPVNAGDLALVITNGDYQGAPATRNFTTRHNNLSDAYTAQGYEVIGGLNLDTDEMRAAVGAFFALSETSDRIVVHFTGRAVHSSAQSWLLPVDQPDAQLLEVDYEAPSLGLLLDVLGQHQGRAFVVLPRVKAGDTQRPLIPNIGDIPVPEGVILLSGGEIALNRFVLDKLLASPISLADALAETDATLRVEGDVTGGAMLAQNPSSTNWIDFVAEQALWGVAENSGMAADFEEYLRRFPYGIYAPAAKARLADLSEPTAEDIENALGLSRDERREIQANLTVLGYDTRGIDGIFGRGSRGAIALWQDQQDLDPTGYLKAAQVRKLQRQSDTRRREVEVEDRAFWQATGASGREADIREYLERYPAGLFAEDAKDGLAVIEAAAVTRADQQAWNTARTINTASSYRTYLSAFPDGLYRALAEDRLDSLDPGGPNPAEVALAKAQEERLNLNTGSKLLIESRLKSLGFDVGLVDGVLNDRSRRAISAFQNSKGLNATGYMDAATVRALLMG